MTLQNIRRILKADCLILLPVMALASYIAFIPYLSYPYTLHLDEWTHLAFSKALLQAGSTNFIDSFLGQSTIGLTPHIDSYTREARIEMEMRATMNMIEGLKSD